MKRKGFTLVELLIVIMIIGILTAGISLINNKATASAKAANIISNLKIMKTAALLFYADHMDSKDSELDAGIITASADYLGDAVQNMAGYGFFVSKVATNAPKKWYVYYNLGHTDIKDDPDIAEVKTKLKGRAKTIGLLGTKELKSGTTTSSGLNKAFGSEANTDTYAFVQVR